MLIQPSTRYLKRFVFTLLIALVADLFVAPAAFARIRNTNDVFSVTIDKGVICALRHIHMTPADALRYGLKDKCTVRVRVRGDREMVFGDVRIRVDPNFALAMHIDTDEANAGNLRNGAEGFIDGIQHED